MPKRVTLLEVWIEPKGVWAAIIRMLGYMPARRRGIVSDKDYDALAIDRAIRTWPDKEWHWRSGFGE